MQYVHKNVGVCSRETIIDIDENHIIQNVEVIGGCDGNLKGVASLLKGLKAKMLFLVYRVLLADIKILLVQTKLQQL